MNLQEVSFTPVGRFMFSDEEIAVLRECSKSHYDGVCKAAGEPRGFLFGMTMRQRHAEVLEGVRHPLDGAQLDTLAKIAEGHKYLSDPPRAAAAVRLNEQLRASLQVLARNTPEPQDVKSLFETAIQKLEAVCPL